MALYDDFLVFIKNNTLIRPGQRVLLAVSGGVDSMVMAHLFSKSGIYIALAHCNFMLRGEQSDMDQQLVKQTAAELQLAFFTTSFNTTEYSSKQGVSIQMAARELRYQWFEQTRKNNGYDLVATAHHLDDSIETLVINLARGTGIRGLKGIPVKNGTLVRPLLFAGRQQIEEYAAENNVSYRQDLSNLEDKYIRNKIRHHIIPVMKEINPNLHQLMPEFFEKMKHTHDILDDAVSMARERCITAHGPQWDINVNEIKKLSNPAFYLYELLRSFNFSATVCKEIITHLDSQPGKRFFSESHCLVTDRHRLIVFQADKNTPLMECVIETDTLTAECGSSKFIFSKFAINEAIQWPESEKEVLLDYDKLEFPLLLRPWHKGDYMQPLGMKGKKKLSDLFIDMKMPLPEKSKVIILESAARIAWVAGVKVDNRFKITKNTKNIFSVKML